MAKTKDKKETVIAENVTYESVEVPLSEKELLALADELMSLESDISKADSELQSAKGHHKSVVEGLNARGGVIKQCLRTKKEYREVECFNEFEYFEGICTVRRADTNAVVRTRKMTVEEFKGERLFKDAPEEFGHSDLDNPQEGE